MNYQLKYEEIVAGSNSEKDRAMIEETFRRLMELRNRETLNSPQIRAG